MTLPATTELQDLDKKKLCELKAFLERYIKDIERALRDNP
jgi:hypothetical protein